MDRSDVKKIFILWGGGGGESFLPNFQESLFLAWNYTLGTNFVPNVLKKSFVSYSVNEI